MIFIVGWVFLFIITIIYLAKKIIYKTTNHRPGHKEIHMEHITLYGFRHTYYQDNPLTLKRFNVKTLKRQDVKTSMTRYKKRNSISI